MGGVGGGGGGEVDGGPAQRLDYFSNVQLLKGWNRSKFGMMNKVCPDRVWEQLVHTRHDSRCSAVPRS